MTRFYKKNIDAYLKSGKRLNLFLSSIVCNDLYSAIGCADVNARQLIAPITEHIIRTLPERARGSMLAMNRWKGIDNTESQIDFSDLL